MRYVPKSKRAKPVQSFFGEFVNAYSGVQYSGSYVQTSNGDFYAYVDGDIDPTQKLTRQTPEGEASHIGDYVDEIPRTDFYFDYTDLKGTALSFTRDVPKADYTLTDINYQQGKFSRFFVKNKVTGDVYEIGPNHYKALTSRNKDFHWPSYDVVQIDWKISGTVADTDVSGYIVEGIQSQNQRAVEEASRIIPEIKNILTDYLEYYR